MTDEIMNPKSFVAMSYSSDAYTFMEQQPGDYRISLPLELLDERTRSTANGATACVVARTGP